VQVKGRNGAVEKRTVVTGIADDKNIEIVSGLSESDTVLVVTKKLNLQSDKQEGKNPFQPARPKVR